jgi:hypothetical protein
MQLRMFFCDYNNNAMLIDDIEQATLQDEGD